MQSRFGVTLRFEFHSEELTYTSRSPGGEHRFSTCYEHIWVRNPSYLTVNNTVFARRFFGANILTVAAICAWTWIARPPAPLAAALLLIALVVFVVIRMKSPFSVYFVLLPVSLDASGTPGYRIQVIDDESGALVIAEIAQRRRNRLRLTHAFVDSANDVERELLKFGWLKENEVIDDHEYQAALAELRDSSDDLGGGRRLH